MPPPPPPPPSGWAPPVDEEAAPPADHEHEAEAVLRELEEEIAREAAEATPSEEDQVTPHPQPELKDEVEAEVEAVTDDEQTSATPSGEWQTTEDASAPTADEQDPTPTAQETPPSDWQPPAEPSDDDPTTATSTDWQQLPPPPPPPSDWRPTTDEPAAAPPTEPSDDGPTADEQDPTPSGWQPPTEPSDDDPATAPSTDWRPQPPADTPFSDWQTTGDAAAPAAQESDWSAPSTAWQPQAPAHAGDDDQQVTEHVEDPEADDTIGSPTEWLPQPPADTPSGYEWQAPTVPITSDQAGGPGPMLLPPTQRGVPPLPPPPPRDEDVTAPTMPTGWLIGGDEDEDEAPVHGPETPAETPAAYLGGAYSSPGHTAVTSGPPQGLPVVRVPPPARWRKQSTLVVGAAVVLVVLLGVFAFIVLQEDSPGLTYNGESIEDAEGTLTSAERTVAAIVEERHGASNDDTRCYFSLKDAGATDVADFLRCGPVLFVDGNEDQPYLTFGLTPDAGDDSTKLVAADQPDAPEPAGLASGEELRRPDDASPPDGAGSLEVPLPQRADPGLFEANPLEGVELQDPGGDAEIVSYGTGYRMTGFAEADRYGHGDAARRPAQGEKFVAVQFEVGLGEFPMVTDSPTLAVQIGDAAPVPIPGDPEATLGSMILSVPEDTDVVDLVVTEQAVEQRLSLLTGVPGDNNIAVLRRDALDHITSASADLSFSASRPGYVTETFTVNVGVSAVRLFWFFGDGGVQHPSGPGRAWLVPETTHAWGPGLNAGPDVSLDPEFFKLTLVDGTVVNASNLATDGRILVAFDVPADFSQGTLSVGGAVTRFNGETWDFGTASLSVPVNIPTG